ncbi:MAG: hypothetical protein KTR29_16595 [Rhodothermaceae bacterium]|nr:hypothetical protein [Rhodothermaceae bacterium]
MKRIILLFASILLCSQVQAQSVSSFDYAIRSVRIYEVAPDSRKRSEVVDLGAYMYDIGPAPLFEFEVEIEQLNNPSPIASHARIGVEQYMLLSAKENHSYIRLDTTTLDMDATKATWTYQSPVNLSFSCDQRTDNVICTSSPSSPQFMNPEDPLTYASPHAFHLLGYAYRFFIEPSNIRFLDRDLSNNAYQVTFMKR